MKMQTEVKEWDILRQLTGMGSCRSSPSVFPPLIPPTTPTQPIKKKKKSKKRNRKKLKRNLVMVMKKCGFFNICLYL